MTEKPSPNSASVLPSILVVEDSLDDLEAVKRAFRKNDIAVKIEHAVSGEEAMAHLRATDKPRPALVLLDLNMPGMGGRKALEAIKGDEKLKQIPVLVLTTSNYEEDILKCYNLGANTYLQKPVDFDELCLAVRKIKEYWFETAMLPPLSRRG
jgi:two-component system, response regulator